jgi:hypothetical protein
MLGSLITDTGVRRSARLAAAAGHKLHPEPIRLPTPYRQFVIDTAKEIKDLCAAGRGWTTLRDSELGEDIRRYIDIIDHQNPHITHPDAFTYSHRSHMTLVSLVAFAYRLADTFADWKAGRILQNQAVTTIRADAHTLYACFQRLAKYDAPWIDPSLIED